jgi:hypothetical protein
MFHLDLSLIVGVLWGMSHNYALINYFLQINKVSINYLIISYVCGFATISLPLLSFIWVFFISSMFSLQMANTRSRVTANNAENNEGNNNQEAYPPPPSPPTLEQVLAMQAQML